MRLITTVNGYPEHQEIDFIWSGYEEPLHLNDTEQRSNTASTLQIEADALPDAFQHHLDSARLILLHLPAFTDGRPYSLAAMLRQHYRFLGVRFVFLVMFVQSSSITCTVVVSIALY